MGWMDEQAQEKLTAYRSEAAFRRQLPKKLWRGWLAQVFRKMAERLEPTPSAYRPDGILMTLGRYARPALKSKPWWRQP